MAIPSIAMIPSGYKDGKVYSVLPTNGDGDFTFARTSAATRLNSNGLIEEVGIGKPRLDYSDGTCPSLLLEPTSTNLISTSDSGNYGSPPASEILTISPDGTNNAVIPVPNAVSNRYRGSVAGGTYLSGQKLTYSWYRKRISTPTGVSVTGDLHIKSLVNLTELETSNATQIESDINGFDRFQAVVEIIDGSLVSTFRAYFGDVVEVGNSSVAYFGHQYEVGSYATSLINTVGTTQTRVADTATGSGNSTVINSSEGVFYAEISALADDLSDRWITIRENANATDNQINIRYAASTNLIQAVSRSAGLGQDVVLQYNAPSITDFNKVAVKYKLNDWALWVNGIEVDTVISSTPFTANSLDKLDFNSGTGSKPFYGKTKDVRVYTTALSDAELTTLTTI